MDQVDRYIDRVQHLPPAPAVLSLLLELFADPNRDPDRLAEIISYDPALTAEVLKRGNSAFYRGSEPASEVTGAVSRLGVNEIHRVIMVIDGKKIPTPDTWTAGNLWWHSVVTAVAAGVLAGPGQETAAAAFTAGLLHDIGKLVLSSLESAAYATVTKQSGFSGVALAHSEQASFGLTHADMGARLLSRWGLPPSITLAVLHHHQSPASAAPFERLAASVHLGNRLAHSIAATDVPGPGPGLQPGHLESLAILQLTEQDLQQISAQTQERLQRVRILLNMNG